jgi:endonuclease YncB( thermonuclease family)
MAKAIATVKTLTVGRFGLGLHGEAPGSVRQQVHDGDTIIVRALGNFSIRFLGIDTPEISFTLPGRKSFTGTAHDDWEAFLSDPFAPAWQLPSQPDALSEHLRRRTGPGCAANHHRHARAAERALEHEIVEDMRRLERTQKSLEFFLAFAGEVMDGYGRLLGYVNGSTQENPRPPDYNLRLLTAGLAMPYFIWPNINPFRRQPSRLEAVPDPGQAGAIARGERTLREARESVAAARADGLGIFAADDPLQLEPFELRFLAGRRLPNRWLIDLSSDSDTLLAPERYAEVPNAEDRLWIPAEFVPLFVEKGWRRQR